MKWARTGIVFAAVLGVSAPAQAAGCPVGLLCAADPAGIVSSLQTQGYKAMLTKSKNTGSSRIDSAAAGYAYSILFYGCDDKGAECTSLGFSTSFSDDGTHTAELANEWNREKRFSVMAIDPADRTLSITYDLSTVGGDQPGELCRRGGLVADNAGSGPNLFPSPSGQEEVSANACLKLLC